MGARLILRGFEELRAALRELPATLSEEASHIITNEATDAANLIIAEYNSHRDTGDLADHVSVKIVQSQFGTSATVKSAGKIAWLFDNGSQARHYVTARGGEHATGQMWGKTPPRTPLSTTMMDHRREMFELLRALLEREGLTVKGIP